MNLKFIFPDAFRYQLREDGAGYISNSDQNDDFDYYVVHSYSYDNREDKTVFASYAISPEHGYMIISWENDDGYLVASTSPETEPQVIIHYFQRFIDVYAV